MVAEERVIGSPEELAQVLDVVFGVSFPVAIGAVFGRVSQP